MMFVSFWILATSQQDSLHLAEWDLIMMFVGSHGLVLFTKIYVTKLNGAIYFYDEEETRANNF